MDELIKQMIVSKDLAYKTNERIHLEELEHQLLSLWLLQIEAYRKYKAQLHNIESKKLLEYSKERELHTSDLQCTKALNKRYKSEIEQKDIAEDYSKVLDKYYTIFSNYAKSLNSASIHRLAEDKINATQIANYDKL